METIKLTEIENYTALHLRLQDIDEFLRGFEQVQAKHKTEITIVYKDKSKDFTLKEFLSLLGFDE